MKKITRRRFLYCSAAFLTTTLPTRTLGPLTGKTCNAAFSKDIGGRVFKGDAPEKLGKWSHEGFLYKKLEDHKVICEICPNLCLLAPGDRRGIKLAFGGSWLCDRIVAS